ncbi:hypothetical protein AMS68_002112 [Peltaster fructicola]|uniref:Acyltransferase 3 domain-containing protein n=1 Tax=Peltaster fructicola TaxID=286661 RepID=A0A6H0XPN5_9PEZI|nr:hypothetical protein AMS68_002112 [Peltaster fructicola]
MSQHHGNEPGNSEIEALLMDDLTVKESTLEAAYKQDPPSAIQRAQRVFIKLFQVATRSLRSSPPRSTTSAQSAAKSSSLICTIFNYPPADFQCRPTGWLDGLRGLAALEVYIFHYMDHWLDRSLAYGEGRFRDPAIYRLPFIRTLYASGDTAVCVFFAISGYVLTHRMLGLIRQRRTEELHASLSSAVFRRGIRLYMPVMIQGFTLMLVGHLFNFPKPGGWQNEPSLLLETKRWVVRLIWQWLPLRYPDRWNELLNMYDGGISWTIPLEYHGSLIVYLALLLFSRTRSIRVRQVIIAGLIVLSFLKDDWIGGQFLLGMAFADYQLEKKTHSQNSEKVRKIFFFVVFLFGFYLAGLPGGHYVDEQQKFRLWSRPGYDWITQPLAAIGMYADRQADRYIECLAGICIVVGLGETDRLKRMLETRFIQYLGKISFGLYLCHIWMHEFILPLDNFWLGFMHIDYTVSPHLRSPSLNYFLAYIMMMTFATTCNFIVAGLFERYIDAPSVQTGKNFEKWCLSFGKDDNDVEEARPAQANGHPT